MNQFKAIPYNLIFFVFVLFMSSANASDISGNLAQDHNSTSETVSDFNHDGRQDVAVKDARHGTVTVYLNNGNGSFSKAGKLANGTNPPQLQMADLNADGKPDLISTRPGAGGLSIAVGRGHGKFKARANYLKGIKPLTVNIGDFNGDEKPDLAAINFNHNIAFLLYGDGNAIFTVQETDPSNLDLLSPLPTELTQENPGDSADTGANALSPSQFGQSSTTAQALVTTAVPTTAALEKSVLQKINAYRVARRLPALTLNATISNVARTHSQNMATGKVTFGHQGFQARRQTIERSITFRAEAENVAWNQGFSDPATTAVNGWINSTGHRNNIVGNYNLTGVGVAKTSSGKYYFTQIFWRR